MNGNSQDVPLWALKYYKRALRDMIEWFVVHKTEISAYGLTSGKCYLDIMRMISNEPENLMAYGCNAIYGIPAGYEKKVEKHLAKLREKSGKDEN